MLRGRAEPLGIDLVVGDLLSASFDDRMFGALVQTPDEAGRVRDLRGFIGEARRHGVLVAVATDLLSLTLLTPPGELGADVAFGNSQRFGVALGYGGPHAAFFATLEKHVRQAPGRIIGVSVDAHGNPAYRMTLQTREQHIRRDKATSNICTAQALLANMAGFYAVYHGPQGLTAIARRVHRQARALEHALAGIGIRQLNDVYFDTLRFSVDSVDRLREAALAARINFRYRPDGTVNVALDETTDAADLQAIAAVFAAARAADDAAPAPLAPAIDDPGSGYPAGLARTSAFLTHPVFNTPPLRDGDDALPAAAGTEGRRPGHLDDPARLVHDEAESGVRDAADHLAGVRAAAPVRPDRTGRGLPRDVSRARGGAPRDHRVRRRLAAAQLRGAGRVRRVDGDSRLPSRPRRRGSATWC